MEAVSIKQEAFRLVEDLHQNATWEDLMSKNYVQNWVK
jgi:hypothetical protein